MAGTRLAFAASVLLAPEPAPAPVRAEWSTGRQEMQIFFSPALRPEPTVDAEAWAFRVTPNEYSGGFAASSATSVVLSGPFSQSPGFGQVVSYDGSDALLVGADGQPVASFVNFPVDVVA